MTLKEFKIIIKSHKIRVIERIFIYVRKVHASTACDGCSVCASLKNKAGYQFIGNGRSIPKSLVIWICLNVPQRRAI